jgi:hypothetical protein
MIEISGEKLIHLAINIWKENETSRIDPKIYLSYPLVNVRHGVA